MTDSKNIFNHAIPYSGPVISPAAKQRITALIASAEEQGGKVVLDGRGVEVPGYPDGNWVAPTIIEATTDMRCYKCVLSVRPGSLFTHHLL